MADIEKKKAALIRKEYEIVKHMLPDAFHEFVALIGIDETLKLIKAYGGAFLPIYQGFTKSSRANNQKIGDVIGNKNAEILVNAFWASRKIYIPKCKAAVLHFRNVEIVRQYNALTKQLPDPEAVRELSLKHQLNTRTIYRILKKTSC
ncbi:Mor transcription activator family protein [Vitreoscilla stercoraria]|uniref:Mor transcription activator domain-containing protein n=1 Tax=Vitreoscilla stercoraria TaxID=61 RepID=A0ABY4EDS4_VITST|nr:Mor transcription activator family protein [Vitreoscilla stercoraria]UOO93560.1 hypothetical protein LVJ81_05925 [Vitreoscilla stercoraria]